MKDILSRAGRAEIRRFVDSGALLAFDFDGTLAPIVGDPDRAAMRATTRALLSRLAASRRCVVISGRARADVARRLGGVPVKAVIGNHGIEPWQATAAARRAVRRWRPLLERRLARLPGVAIEDKAYSIAVHYRHAREKAVARAAIGQAAAALDGARVVPGKQVLNLLPWNAPDKGTALARALARFRCRTAVYVGDDDTDEDAFAIGRGDSLLAIRVGRRKGSCAPYYLRNQAEIDRLLRALTVS